MFKVCSTCGDEKLIGQFRKDRTQKDGYQPRCKVCARQASRSAYMTYYGEKAKSRNLDRQRNLRQRVQELKQLNSCVCCGEDSPICLDFHHRDPTEKDFSIASISTQSWETILAEIQKCVVVCRNCHAKIHANLLTVL